MSTKYCDCGGENNSPCENHLHGGERVKNGQCKIGRAWSKGAKPCAFCQALVPDQLGARVNPFTLGARVEFLAGGKIKSGTLSPDPETRVCDACAEKKMRGINPQSENPGMVRVGGELEAAFLPVSMLPTPVTTISQIVRRGRVLPEEFSRKKQSDGVTLTECTMHRVCPSVCNTGNGECLIEEMRAVQVNQFSLVLVCGPCATEILRDGTVSLISGTGAEAMSRLLGQPIGSGRRDNVLRLPASRISANRGGTSYDPSRAQMSFQTVANGVGERKRTCRGKKYTAPRQNAPAKPVVPGGRCKKCAAAQKPCRKCKEKAAVQKSA